MSQNKVFMYVAGAVIILAALGGIGYGGYLLYKKETEKKAIEKMQHIMQQSQQEQEDYEILVENSFGTGPGNYTLSPTGRNYFVEGY